MSKIIKKFILAILIVTFVIFLSSIVTAEPTLNSVTTDPEKPEPLGQVTVMVNFTGENILNVSVIASECSDQTKSCYNNTFFDMTYNSETGLYTTTFTLLDKQGITDHIQWYFNVNDSGVTYNIEGGKTYLNIDTETPSNGNTDSGDSDSDTPGFELILMLAAIFLAIVYYNKKR